MLRSIACVSLQQESSNPHLGMTRNSGCAVSLSLVGSGLCFVLLLTLAMPVKSAVLSIDLGSEWMKVAVVNLKAGQSPISIAINEMSKRKSPALVAFSNGNRLVGEEAAGIAARYPERVYYRLRDMVGKPFTDVKRLLDSQYLPYDIVEDARGAASIRIEDGETVFSSEELVAMLLNYGKSLAEAHVKGVIKDAVITVPPYLGQTERECLLDAAQLAGLTVLALLNEHSGAALQYGIDKDFSNGSRNVVFYDMGANSVYAALVYYSAYTSKEFGRNVTVNQFQVKDVRWDASLGGQTLEMKLVEYFADEFNKQVGGGLNIRQHPKSLAKLKKQVKRTKEILSANTEAPLSVEALYGDLDFRSTISRVKFEELCKDLWEQALGPIKEVLKHSGLTVEDLDGVELIGGATRVPKLQAVLSEFLGKRDLDRHLDADEAIALGAALHAANLSDGFKMNRKLGMVDGVSYGIIMHLKDYGSTDGEDSDYQVVVPRMKKLPSKLFKSLKITKDFMLSLEYDPAGISLSGSASAEIATFRVSGVREAFSKYGSRNMSAPMKTNVHFSLSRSGVLSLDRAESVIEVSEWVEIPVGNITSQNSKVSLNVTVDGSMQNEDNVETTGNISGGASSEKVDWETNVAVDTEDSKSVNKSDNSDSQKNPTTDVKPLLEKKLRKKTFRVPLKIEDISAGLVRPMTKETLLKAGLRLEKLNHLDAEKKQTAELKNSLEEYIYATKEKLDSAEGIEKVSTKEGREYFRQQLSDVEDWLYTDGEDAPTVEFKKRLETLKAIGDPIFFRLAEVTDRPAAVHFAQQYIDGLKEILDGWEQSKPWISQRSKDEVLEEAHAIYKWLAERDIQQQKYSLSPLFFLMVQYLGFYVDYK
eukprot:c28651_g1_i2 orf=645-3266(-)